MNMIHSAAFGRIVRAAACALLLGLTSCTAPGSTPEVPAMPAPETRSLTVLTNRIDLIENGVFDGYAKRFEAEHPGADVRFEGLSDYAGDIMTRLSTREAGDVLLLPINMPGSELPNFFAPLKDELFENMRFADMRKYGDRRYGLATGTATDGIIYNKKAFEQAGIDEIPQTLDEFFAACAKLKDIGIVPVYLNYGAKWPLKEWGDILVNYSSGRAGYLNRMALTDEPWQLDGPWGDSLKIVRRLVREGYAEKNLFANTWETSKTELASGRAAMYFQGSWAIRQLVDAGADPDEIGFFPFPYDNGGSYYAPLNPDYFIGVSKFSAEPELAQDWVEFFVKKSGFVDDWGFLPVDSTQTPKMAQFREFLSFRPTFVEGVQTGDAFIDLAERANFSFWSGGYMQELIAADDLGEAFDRLNRNWKEARSTSSKP
ncbi:ABC transporter substrate-binding protein [Saccharibacillus alkalitolerans]|uniref:Extracellular solute-binding protein n=1 Tax=Saccharibacillus alkalitolerans TaxID=2705290 RepID=A0ABX0FBC6_9BACL|nr:extracellular solute-binding protein [Saccharibacillus alkalitolerans]NGZ75327.1 extracellular solute-binding protein [Saccharibacillus alkalitolerans]